MDLNLPKMRTMKGPASLLKRVFAFALDLILIDLFIISPFSGVTDRIFGDVKEFSFAEYRAVAEAASGSQVLWFTVLTIGLLSLFYLSIMIFKFRQTFGMKIVGISVDVVEGEMTFWRSLLRNLFILPFLPFILLWIIDPVWMFFNKNNQRLTEVLSKTRVVEKHKVL